MAEFTYTIADSPHAQGAQGAVYFATRSDGQPVAIKVAAEHDAARRGLVTEIEALRACAAAGVSGVVQVLDTTEVHGRPALVMPRYPKHLGEWMEQLHLQPGPETLGKVLSKCAELARILAEVQRVQHKGVALIHRDVKPENVFLDDKDQLILGDFGGAMGIDGLKAVEMGVFGTPMWAPFDQILPGTAIPDPTWDTYALCVILFAGLTRARPAYQADPRNLLTARGRELWETACLATNSEAARSRTLRQAFHAGRRGTLATDLVDFTGHSALTRRDRRALDFGIEQLATLAGLEEQTIGTLQRGCWNLLVRGLSPASHPSPPNRYRDARELAQLLEDLRALCERSSPAPQTDRLAALLEGDIKLPGEPVRPSNMPAKTPGLSMAFWLVIGLVAVMGAVWVLRDSIEDAAMQAGWLAPSGQLSIPQRIVSMDGENVQVDSFLLDRIEVTNMRWKACVEAGKCSARDGPARHPVVGISLEEATAFCAWAGGRLPTPGEYRASTAGGPWPWGDDTPSCAHAVGRGCGGPLPAGAAPLGASADGAFDLAGNAWEWLADGTLVGGGADSGSESLGRRGLLVPDPDDGPPHPWAGVRCAYAL